MYFSMCICVYVFEYMCTCLCTGILLSIHTKIRLGMCKNMDKSQVLYEVKEVNLKSKHNHMIHFI